MKKVLFFLLSVILLGCTNVYAASDCSYEEQAKYNNEVANIKAKYEEATKKVKTTDIIECQDGTNDCITDEYTDVNYFVISLLNMNENFYITMENNQNSDTRTIRYSDLKDGVYTFDYTDIYQNATLTFKVYSSDKTNCQNELYRTIYLTTPRYNKFSEYEECKENPDFELCRKYTPNGSYMDEATSHNKLEKYKENSKPKEEKKENKSPIENIKQFIVDNKTVVIIVAVVAVVGVGIIVFVIARRRKKSVL